MIHARILSDAAADGKWGRKSAVCGEQAAGSEEARDYRYFDVRSSAFAFTLER
jgi:hypothetical protein